MFYLTSLFINSQLFVLINSSFFFLATMNSSTLTAFPESILIANISLDCDCLSAADSSNSGI